SDTPPCLRCTRPDPRPPPGTPCRRSGGCGGEGVRAPPRGDRGVCPGRSDSRAEGRGGSRGGGGTTRGRWAGYPPGAPLAAALAEYPAEAERFRYCTEALVRGPALPSGDVVRAALREEG